MAPEPNIGAQLDRLYQTAADKIDELRQERDSARAAIKAWKGAFSDLHETLEKIANSSAADADVLRAIALDALHTEGVA